MDNPYLGSVFRWLGLSATASVQECQERFRELSFTRTGLSERSIYLLSQADLPWLDRTSFTSEELTERMAVLKAWRQRLRARAFWYHAETDSDRQALAQLLASNPGEAVKIWKQAWQESIEQRTSAAHNLAVLYHSRALACPRGGELFRQDIQEATRWWGHIIDGGRLKPVLLDGEGDLKSDSFMEANPDFDPDALLDLVEEIKAEITTLLSYARFRSSIYEDELLPNRTNAAGTPQYFGGIAGEHNSLKVRMAMDLELATEYARLGWRERVEKIITHYEDLALAPQEQKTLAAKASQLFSRLILRGTKPTKEQPFLSCVNGLGATLTSFKGFDVRTRSFSARLVYKICYLPVFTLGRYRVREKEPGHWELISKYPLEWPTCVHNAISVWLLCGAIFGISVFSGLLGQDRVDVRAYPPVKVASISITAQDWQKMASSRRELLEMRLKLECQVKLLQEERERIIYEDLPALQQKTAKLNRSSKGSDNQAVITEYRQQSSKLQKRLREIPITINKLHEVLALLVELEG